MLKSKNSKGRVGKKKQRSSQAVAAPAAVGTKSVTRAPRVSMINGGCVVTHSEPITGVMSSTNVDTIFSYVINPGDATTFPWLGQIANAWDFYQIRSLRFRFISRLPSTVYSTIVLCIDYDVLDAVPTDLVQMRQMAGAVSGNGWMPLSINWSPSGVLMGSGSRKTRIASVPADNLTDVGRLVVGSNTSITAICGEIWVDYTVALFKPQQIAPVETYGADFPSNDEAVLLPSTSTEGESFYNFLAGSLIETTSNLPVSVVPSPMGEGGLGLRLRLPWLLGHRDVHISLSNRSALTATLYEPLITTGAIRPKMYTQSVNGTISEMAPDTIGTWVAEFLSDAALTVATSTLIGTAWNHFQCFHLRVPDNFVYTAQSTVAVIIVFLFKAYFSTGPASAPDMFYLMGSDVHIDPGPRETPNDFSSLMSKHRDSFIFKGERIKVCDVSDCPNGTLQLTAFPSSGHRLVEPRVSKDTQSAGCCTSQTTPMVTATENSSTLETQRPTLCPCCNRT